jgi:hypothetical protein
MRREAGAVTCWTNPFKPEKDEAKSRRPQTATDGFLFEDVC